ncbi:hypothetical protein ACHHYP_07050 [Achlya hypogyna]|uniref:Uncharacterized protein n=1 Tax=Achlya hypogyna TaxID=1202772 RepID=A0A1V9YRE9_ACHHY|nr:hypothetical protein ACHHYP_07050 [Achlya hypogyna]
MSGDESRLPSLSSSRSSSEMSSGRTVPASPRYNNDESDDEAPGATGELYTEIESFLNRPSPRQWPCESLGLAAIAKGSRSTENLLPTLKSERSKLRTDKPEHKRVDRPPPKKGPLDLGLVQQAFAYAKNLQSQQLQDTADSDGEDQLQSVIQQQLAKAHVSKAQLAMRSAKGDKPRSAPKKKAAKAKSAAAIYNNAKPERPRQPVEWDNNSEPTAKSSSSMDPQLLQQLLSNFENGTTLHELRQELAASQASLKESRSILQSAAKSFFLKQ